MYVKNFNKIVFIIKLFERNERVDVLFVVNVDWRLVENVTSVEAV